MDYNTQRPGLILPEYGRNIHQMVNFLKTITDKDERNEQARIVIDVMSSISPQIKNKEEMAQRLWTQLMIMAEFDLDVDIPIEIPDKDKIFDKPEVLNYPKNKIKVRHYGHNIELLLEKIDLYEGEELEQYVEQVLNQMKKLYLNWNKDLVSDDIIIKDFKRMTKKDFDFLKDMQLADIKIPKMVVKKKQKQKKK
jgi:hypothetical protein